MILFRIFIGILLFLPVFSSAEFVEDITSQVQPVSENQAYTMEAFGQVVSREDVYQYQENMDTHISSLESCDSNVEDCTQIYDEQNGIHTNTSSPYAPFPWPCDSLEDCARIYHNNIENMEGVIGKNMNAPYAPFPWPCDSFEDCARTYRESIEDIRGLTEIESMNTPYAPFPWPCDSLEDCARTYRENVRSERGLNMNTPYAPFPWPCDSMGDCARQVQVRQMGVSPF